MRPGDWGDRLPKTWLPLMFKSGARRDLRRRLGPQALQRGAALQPGHQQAERQRQAGPVGRPREVPEAVPLRPRRRQGRRFQLCLHQRAAHLPRVSRSAASCSLCLGTASFPAIAVASRTALQPICLHALLAPASPAPTRCAPPRVQELFGWLPSRRRAGRQEGSQDQKLGRKRGRACFHRVSWWQPHLGRASALPSSIGTGKGKEATESRSPSALGQT